MKFRIVHRMLHHNSSFSKSEIDAAKTWLLNFLPSAIPRKNFDVSYSRSSGPGGQKVNKTSSKATISLQPHHWLNPKVCEWIPSPVLSRLQQNPFRYQTKAGGLVIQSDIFRSQDANTKECFRKLLAEIRKAVVFEDDTSPEDKEKWAKLEKVRKKNNMEAKKRQSEKRKSRSMKFDF